MSLCSSSVSEFMKILGSDSPAPGGGTVSALSGEAGAALFRMVSGLTIGKKKYAEFETDAKNFLEIAGRSALKFEELAQKDSQSFDGVTAVFKMPKNTEEEKAQRKKAMEEALKACVIPPFSVMELSLDTLKEIKKSMGKLNKSALSDLGVAALSLKTAVSGAYLNVLINIGGIQDENFRNKYIPLSENIYNEAVSMAEKIYGEILNILLKEAKGE